MKTKPASEARNVKLQNWLWSCITKEAQAEGLTQAAVIRRTMMRHYGKLPFKVGVK